MRKTEYNFRRVLGILQTCHCTCSLQSHGFCTDKRERIYEGAEVILCSNVFRWIQNHDGHIEVESRKKRINYNRLWSARIRTGDKTVWK